MNSGKVQAEICALRECIQERDEIVVQMTTNAEEGSPRGEQEGEDPSVCKSQVKGEDLHELASQMDTFEEDIQRGYMVDPFFRKVIKKMGTHPSFEKKNGIIYTKTEEVRM